VVTPSPDARQPRHWPEDALIDVVDKVDDLASKDVWAPSLRTDPVTGTQHPDPLASKCASPTNSLAKYSVSMLSMSPRRAAAISIWTASAVDLES